MLQPTADWGALCTNYFSAYHKKHAEVYTKRASELAAEKTEGGEKGLKVVSQRLRENGVKLSKDKCTFGMGKSATQNEKSAAAEYRLLGGTCKP